MANQPVAGAMSYANYALETSAYATAGSPMVAAFGKGQTLTTTSRNNMERVFQIGQRSAAANVAKQFEGTATIDFVASAPWFWRMVLGSAIDTTGSAHTFFESDVIPSFTIENGINFDTTDMNRLFRGAQVNTATIRANVNELVRVSLDCPYANETANSTINATPLTTAEDPLNFAEGTIVYGGSTIANVQSFELTVNNNPERVWGIGNRFATIGIAKQREYGLRMTMTVKDPVLLNKFYGGAVGPSGTTPATADLKLSFAHVGGQPSSLVIALGSVFLDEETMTHNPTELIKEDVTGWALYCGSVVAIDTTSAPHA